MSINSEMTALADAIRAKSGVSGKLSISGMASAVNNIVINQGSDIDFSGVNVTADKMLSGTVAINAAGSKVTGTIQTVTATLSDNVVTVPAGYVASKQTLTVAEMSDPSVSANVVTIAKGYNKAQKTVTIAEAGEATVSDNVVTIPVGYIKSQRTATVAVASAPSTSGNVVTINKGYHSAQKKITVGTAKAAATITPGTSDQTIAADTYLSGKQTIKGDVNLTAENIKSGVSIFNIEGTFEGTGGSGGGGGGGAVDLYKCVSVNGDTWTGRKAVMEDNQYTIQNTVTSGLSCSGGLTVQKGKVYSADGKIRVNSAYNHCLLSCPWRLTTFPDFGDAKIVEFGSRAAIDYEKTGKDGVGYCVRFGGGTGGGSTDDAYIIIGNLPRLDAFTLEFYAWFIGGGNSGYWAKNANVVFLKDQTTGAVLSTPNVDNLVIPASTSWEHIAIVRQSGSSIVKIYSNGVHKCDTDFSSIITGNIKICFYVAFLNPANNPMTDGGGWMSNLMIYDYAKYNTDFTPPEQLQKPEWEDPQTLTVSGAGIEEANGVYELITPTASGRDRIWAKDSIIIVFDYEWGSWMIKNGNNNYYSGYEDGDPWSSEWWDATDDESGGDSPTVTLN